MQAVLTLKLSGEWSGNDLQRAEMLLRSISHFWADSSPLDVFIITRNSDIDQLRGYFDFANLKIQLVREDTVIDCLVEFGALSGWYKQQALKIAAHKVVDSDFFLVLDADIICCRELYSQSLLINNKAITDWELRSSHSEWWINSARILTEQLTSATFGLSVTPQLLNKTACNLLDQKLRTICAGDPWRYLLSNPGWTEYSLYTLASEKEGILEKNHQSLEWMKKNKVRLRSEHSIWAVHQFDNWRLEDYKNVQEEGYFLVVQSNMGIHPDRISEKMAGLYG